MIKRFIFHITTLVILSLFSFNLAANSGKEVLLQKIKAEKSDSIKCLLLAELIELESDNNIWPEYNRQLKQIAQNGVDKGSKDQKQFYLKMLSEGITNDGFLKQANGKFNEALSDYRKAMDIKLDIHDRDGLSTVLINIGYLYQLAADYSKAISYYNRCLKLQEEIKNKADASTTLVNLATIYLQQNDTSKYQELILKALEYKQEVKDINGIANCYNSLAVIEGSRKHFSEGIAYCEGALKILKAENEEQLGHTYNNLGSLYSHLQQFDRAMGYYKEGLRINKKIGDNRNTATSLNQMGSTNRYQNKIKEAKVCYEEAMLYAKKGSGLKEMTVAAEGLAIVYTALRNKADADKMNALHSKLKDSTEKKVNIVLSEPEISESDSLTSEMPIVKEYLVSEEEDSPRSKVFIISTGILAIILGLVIRRFLKRKKF